MATVFVDDKAVRMNSAENLLHGCLSLGYNLPYFCWHPALGSVGACRQCAVKQFKDDHDTKGRLVMACMTAVADGARISITDPEAALFRKSVIEGLMISHPHDCPVCDEGGECHLQDMTYMTGHDYRRYRFEKRTFHNQNLGPLVNHEMNRCIQCYRCVRYYREYAGGRDFDAFALRNIVFFGREQDGTLENEFSGTWWKSARPGSLPIRRAASITRASGTCSTGRRSARIAAPAAISRRRNGTARCAILRTVTTMK